MKRMLFIMMFAALPSIVVAKTKKEVAVTSKKSVAPATFVERYEKLFGCKPNTQVWNLPMKPNCATNCTNGGGGACQSHACKGWACKTH